MNCTKKFLHLLISVILLLSVISSNFTVSINAEEIEYEGVEQKIYSNATLDDDFTDDRILVVMNNSTSLELNSYDINHFPEIDIKSVSDFSSATREKAKKQLEKLNYAFEHKSTLKNEEIISYKKYNQVLGLELSEPGKENVLNAIEILMQRDDVIYAGPDYTIYLCAAANDSRYGLQQTHTNIQQIFEAWDITTGSNSVLVGVLDSGIQGNHEDLVNRIDVGLSRNYTNGKEETVPEVTDDRGHGTHVAGIIGAQGNNGIGTCGVCWDVTLVSLQVVNANNASSCYWVANAIDYAERNDILLLNFSSSFKTSTDFAIYSRLVSYRGLFVCSAGNQGKNNDTENTGIFPANYNNLPNVITVGASDMYDRRWEGEKESSNYGKTKVDIFATGANILSTYPNNTTRYMSGTSMAAPMVTGVAALLLTIHPDLTAAQLKQIIMNSVDIVYDDEGKSVFGDLCVSGGRLNAYKALTSTLAHSYSEFNIGDSHRHNVVCSECNYTYQEYHAYSYTSNGQTGHARVCTDCSYTDNAGHAYTYIDNNDPYTHDRVCEDCNYSPTVPENHTFNYTSSGTIGHTAECEDCGYEASTEEHSFVCENVNYEHIVICEDCNYIPPRAITYLNQGVASGHTARCSNCSYSATESHDWTDLSGSYRCLKCNVTTTTIPGIMSWEDEEETE